MIDIKNYGKFKETDVFTSYNTLTEECIRYRYANFPCLKFNELPPELKLLYRFVVLGESTSDSVRLLLNYNCVVPALMLIRIRLEQVIIFSYLTNEDPTIGILNFVKFLPSSNARIVKGVLDNKQLVDHFKNYFQKYAISDENESSNSELDFKRKWTDLDLLSMAKRRDDLVKNDEFLVGCELEPEYAAFYRMFSSLVHCDISAITDSFTVIKTKKVEDDIYSMILPDEFYFKFALLLNSQYDIIQNYEFFKFLKIDNLDFRKIYWIPGKNTIKIICPLSSST
ncbi:MAG: DUF5677 domain-containing protein [Anaerolineaceae bacterium]